MIRLIGSGLPTATQNVYTYDIVEKLSKAYCVNSLIQPIVTTTFKVASTELVGTTLYAKVQSVINVVYQPKNQCNCNQGVISNTFAEEFTISFSGATSTSTIAVTSTDGYSDPAYVNTSNCNYAQGIRDIGTVTATFTA